MSAALGFVSYSANYEGALPGCEHDYSETTASAIDAEVKCLTSEAFQRATRLLDEHREQFVAITEALLMKETLEGAALQAVLVGDGHEMAPAELALTALQ